MALLIANWLVNNHVSYSEDQRAEGPRRCGLLLKSVCDVPPHLSQVVIKGVLL